MYENQTEQVIKQRMLNRISDDYDKREGELIHDTIAPTAAEFEQIYIELDNTVDKMSIDNLEGEELAERVYERTGAIRKEATYAIGSLDVVGNSEIKPTDVFQTENGIQFSPTEVNIISGSGTIAIKALIAGSSGMVPANQIKYMPVSIPGIVSVNNPASTTGGYNEEPDKDLLGRYYERVKTPATSGNKAHYKNWAKEVVGVGDAKIIPLWNGPNTVKVIIINSNKQPADSSLVNQVQEYIDPNAEGVGNGVAPIGAKCTVVSASAKVLNISFTAVKDPAYSDETRQASVESNIKQYLKAIAFVENTVSYAKIGSLILASNGISDYSSLLIDGGNESIVLSDIEIPQLGSVAIA